MLLFGRPHSENQSLAGSRPHCSGLGDYHLAWVNLCVSGLASFSLCGNTSACQIGLPELTNKNSGLAFQMNEEKLLSVTISCVRLNISMSQILPAKDLH